MSELADSSGALERYSDDNDDMDQIQRFGDQYARSDANGVVRAQGGGGRVGEEGEEGEDEGGGGDDAVGYPQGEEEGRCCDAAGEYCVCCGSF